MPYLTSLSTSHSPIARCSLSLTINTTSEHGDSQVTTLSTNAESLDIGIKSIIQMLVDLSGSVELSDISALLTDTNIGASNNLI